MLTHQGDIVAYQVGDAPALSQVIAKWRALDTLRTLSAPHSLKLRLEPGGGWSAKGSPVRPAGRASLRLSTLFNLAADGTVQFLYPQPDEAKTIAVDRPVAAIGGD
ncbi:MAG: hypothetical protein IPK63_23510 [Candidatus Competibacteraceae bacterium]|nr:hypothetical protein [Candidatus Competibacteraceae bacterium]